MMRLEKTKNSFLPLVTSTTPACMAKNTKLTSSGDRGSMWFRQKQSAEKLRVLLSLLAVTARKA